MKPDESVHSFYSKNTKILFKAFLIMIEDLNNDHLRNFEKLRNSIPKEHQPLIDQADYFDQRKLQYLRKIILDLGNETIRTTENSLENFTISFKF